MILCVLFFGDISQMLHSFRSLFLTLRASAVRLKNPRNFAFFPVSRSYSSYLQKPKLVEMKINISHFQILFTPETKILSELFHKYGYELRIAGGAVRDILMNKEPTDIDFATTATPEQMMQMFTSEGIRTINKRGEKHGTVTVHINDINFEITTLRLDVSTDGRHAEVQFTTDWELDAGRRDLTVNAMFLGLDGKIYDYFRGIDHVEKRQIIFVGDAACRIKEDYLRILRYFRFYGRLAINPDDHDADTLKAIRENVGGLKMISGERIWVELKKTLSGNHAKHIMMRMIDLGVAPFIGLSEHPNIVEFESVCNHSAGLQPQPVTLLTALLRDETEALTLQARLKSSKYERDLALFIISHRNYAEEENPLQFLKYLILECKNKVSDTFEWVLETLKYQGDVDLYDKLRNWEIPKFPINGHLLMQKGFKQGPNLQKALSLLKLVWIESDCQLTRDQLLEKLPNAVKVK